MVVAAGRAEELAALTVLSLETRSSIVDLEVAYTSNPALNSEMVLFKTIIQVGTPLIPEGLAQHVADQSGAGALAIHPSSPGSVRARDGNWDLVRM